MGLRGIDLIRAETTGIHAGKTRMGMDRRPRRDGCGNRVLKLCSMALTKAAQGKVSAQPLLEALTIRIAGSSVARGNESHRIQGDDQLHKA